MQKASQSDKNTGLEDCHSKNLCLLPRVLHLRVASLFHGLILSSSALPPSARGSAPASSRAQVLLYQPSVLPSPGRKDPALSLLSCRSPRLTPWAAVGILHQWTWGHGGDWLPESTGQGPRKGARRTSSCSDHQSDSRLQLRPRAGPPSRSQDVAVTCYKCLKTALW